tara:strand:- start:286 stop:552 length:267 start_codon:yes stop_codon:yes gene_type:complete
MLIKGLLELTPPTHVDYKALQRALRVAKEFNVGLNRKKADLENEVIICHCNIDSCICYNYDDDDDDDDDCYNGDDDEEEEEDIIYQEL